MIAWVGDRTRSLKHIEWLRSITHLVVDLGLLQFTRNFVETDLFRETPYRLAQTEIEIPSRCQFVCTDLALYFMPIVWFDCHHLILSFLNLTLNQILNTTMVGTFKLVVNDTYAARSLAFAASALNLLKSGALQLHSSTSGASAAGQPLQIASLSGEWGTFSQLPTIAKAIGAVKEQTSSQRVPWNGQTAMEKAKVCGR